MKRIFVSLICILIFLTVASLLTLGNAWLPLMSVMGATIGVVMGLYYPFSVTVKVAYIIGLVISSSVIVFGFKKHKEFIGQFSAVLGIVLWSLLGVLGLGTGT